MKPPDGKKRRQWNQHEHQYLPRDRRRRMFDCWELIGEILTFTSLCRGMRRRCESRAADRQCIGSFDLREEAVAATRNRFHKAGIFGRIAEGITNLVDCL